MNLSTQNTIEHRSYTLIYLANKWETNNVMLLPGASTSTSTGCSSSSCSCGAIFGKK